MLKKVTLTHKQRKFVIAMLTQPDVATAADAAGISRQTAYRYLRTEAVQVEIDDALRVIESEATIRVVGAMISAIATLDSIANSASASDSARVSAARSIIDTACKLRRDGGVDVTVEVNNKTDGLSDEAVGRIEAVLFAADYEWVGDD
jgi:phage terminase small subunit